MTAADYTRGGAVETEEGEIFLEQNPSFESLMGTDLEDVVDQFAEFHCGGLFVLSRPADGGRLFVKCHETWGPGRPDEPGDVVVHLYDADDEEREVVRYFDNPAVAVASFLVAGPEWLEGS